MPTERLLTMLHDLKRNDAEKSVRRIWLTVILISAFALSCSNGSVDSSGNSGAKTPEVKLTAVERDVKSMKTANFEYIFVFRRKDGGVFDAQDKFFLKANSPADTNRFVLSDDDKAVVAGSSYIFEPKNLEKLRERFEIEDHSISEIIESNNGNVSNVSNSKDAK